MNVEDYEFDDVAAHKPRRFFEHYLKHTKAEWAGKPLVLEPWQQDRMFGPLFGWKHKTTKLRRYRTAYVEVPKKNGKSTSSAGLALYLLFGDDEPGAEIYSAAGDKDQARIVFADAKRMLEASPALSKRAKPYRDAIEVPATGSVYRVVSAEAYTKDGLNIHAVVFDEVHVQPNRELWDVMTKSQAARRQPLTIAITTAGTDLSTLCGGLHQYGQKVLAGEKEDPTFLPVIFAAAHDEDWNDREVWKRANPSLGISVKIDFLEKEYLAAQESAAAENSFRRYHLNQWVGSEAQWLASGKWKACGEKVIREEDLLGRECFLGLDLSAKWDWTAAVYVFPNDDGTYDVLPRFWIPQGGLTERESKAGVSISRWVEQGLVVATPGDVIDHATIRATLLEDLRKFKVQEGAFDPWNALEMHSALTGAGLEMVECGQKFKTLSEPTKELEARILAKRIHHGGNAVLTWMAGNAMALEDNHANLKLIKPKRNSPKKIDGVVALVMAMFTAMAHEKEAPSVYEGSDYVVGV